MGGIGLSVCLGLCFEKPCIINEVVSSNVYHGNVLNLVLIPGIIFSRYDPFIAPMIVSAALF